MQSSRSASLVRIRFTRRSGCRTNARPAQGRRAEPEMTSNYGADCGREQPQASEWDRSRHRGWTRTHARRSRAATQAAQVAAPANTDSCRRRRPSPATAKKASRHRPPDFNPVPNPRYNADATELTLAVQPVSEICKMHLRYHERNGDRTTEPDAPPSAASNRSGHEHSRSDLRTHTQTRCGAGHPQQPQTRSRVEEQGYCPPARGWYNHGRN